MDGSATEEKPVHSKGLVVRTYEVTLFGEELSRLVEETSLEIAKILSRYDTEGRKLAEKYGIPKKDIPAALGILFDSDFARGIGYITPENKNL